MIHASSAGRERGPARSATPETFNFRDLGGHPTASGGALRSRLVFRGGSLHLCEVPWLPALSTVIDLRSPAETADGGGREPFGEARLLRAPMLRDTWSVAGYDRSRAAADILVERYFEMLEVGAGAIASAVEALAEPRALPAAFFCTAGKDRTGVLAAILLSALAVPDEAIASDYAASEAPVLALFEWLRANELPGAEHGDPRRSLLDAPEDAMLTFLARMRQRHGDARSYLREIGVSGSTLKDLERALTVGPG